MVLPFGNANKQTLSLVTKCVEVEGSVDPNTVVEKFASHFSSAYMHNNEDRAKALCAEYNHVSSNYCGFLKTGYR